MKCKKNIILQPNYIPWKGYFDLINMADEFVIYDLLPVITNNLKTDDPNSIKAFINLMHLDLV